MGISFNDLVQNERTVTIDVNGGDLTLTYNPSKLSPAFMSKVGDEIDEDDPLGFARLFCEVVSSWNLEGPLGEGEHRVEAGEPVPVEPEYVAWVPGTILRYLVEQIGEDSAPKSRKRSRR